MNKEDEVVERTTDAIVLHKKGGVFYISHGSWAIIKKHFENLIVSERKKLFEEIEKFRPLHWELNKNVSEGCAIWISNKDWKKLKEGRKE